MISYLHAGSFCLLEILPLYTKCSSLGFKTDLQIKRNHRSRTDHAGTHRSSSGKKIHFLFDAQIIQFNLQKASEILSVTSSYTILFEAMFQNFQIIYSSSGAKYFPERLTTTPVNQLYEATYLPNSWQLNCSFHESNDW